MDIRADSTEWVYGTVTADHDLSLATLHVALPATGVAPTTWYEATVADVAQISSSPTKYKVTYRLMIGPSGGSVTLAAGTYDWVLRITDSPEQPIRKTGTIEVS
jgi:hypothetical protein